MTRSERARVLAIAACLAILPSAALADETAADPLVPFEDGRALVRSGRYAEALAKFEESYKIKATSGAALNAGDCYEKLGRYASASAMFTEAARLADEKGQAERAKEANDRRAAVEPLVSTLQVNAPPGTTLVLDGVPSRAAVLHRVDGGEHVVRVEMACHVPTEVRVSIALRGENKTISVEPGARSDDPACGGPPPTMNVVSSNAPPSTWSSQKTVAVVMGGASVVAIGAGIGFGFSAIAKKDELASACRDYPNGCPSDRRNELETTYDDASRAAAYSTLGIIAGTVFLGAAIGLYLTAPKNPSRIAKSPFAIAF